ncbi:MAG: bifunctional 3'-5' exonuclease/DNA polymerase [Chloroflexi bacterium]|nr:bifunctional 3'-5' exonuclease/DNA polymerase [Chloroflexota bacterium]
MQRLSLDQLLSERARYAAELAQANGNIDARRVAQARLAEIDAEIDRRQASPNGHKPHPGNRWPQVDLVELIRESGCTLTEKEHGKWHGDHACAHGSKSGTCLVVWADEGRWHCTSCKRGGDAASWLAHVEGIEYRAAARKLRERFGLSDEDDTERKSQAELLVELAADAEYFHDALQTTYATVRIGDHTETWPIHARGFTLWLTGRFFATYQKPVNADALTNALRVLDYRAMFEGPCLPVYRRVAPDGQGGAYLDLADPNWRAVHVTPYGWEIVSSPPVRFMRTPGMQPLPEPVGGGSLDELRKLVNVPDNDAWALVRAWLVAAIAPTGPYPVLVLRGEQGSAKSTLARMLRALVDPAQPALRRPPREERDLAIAARACWVVAFDNLSHIPDWLSDGLCALATGGGFATRQLYTDFDEALFDAQRPVVLNGITDFISRDDLLDRVVSIELPRIPDERRRDEAALWADFRTRHAAMLGALLDTLAGALRERSALRLARLPRMADFARLAAAAERAEVGPEWSEATSVFLRAYGAVRAEAHEQAIEASVVGPALLRWLRQTTLPWIGTATDLLVELNSSVDERQTKTRGWPKTAHHLSSTLRRLAPALRHVGYFVEFGREGSDRKRTITISSGDTPPEKTGHTASAASATQNIPDFPNTDAKNRADADLGASVREASAGTMQRPHDEAGATDADAADAHADADFHEASAELPYCHKALDAADAADASVPPSPGVGWWVQIGDTSWHEVTRIERRDGKLLLTLPTAGRVIDAATVRDARPPTIDEAPAPASAPPGPAPVTNVSGSTENPANPAAFSLLTDAAAVQAALPALLAAPVLGLDCETTGLDPHRDRLRLVQIATPERVFLVDAFAVDVGLLGPVLESEQVKVLHNAKFDLQFLLAQRLTVRNVFDTMLADQLLRGSRVPRSLADLAREYLGQTLDKTEQTADWSGRLTPTMLEYAATDAVVLLPLHEKLSAALKDAKLERVASLENRAVPAIAWLEYAGAPFDADAWRQLADSALAEKLRLEDELTALAEELAGKNTLFERRINWDAPEQVKRLLAECGISVPNTTEDALAPLAEQYPIVKKLLDYREVAKRCGTYGLNVLGDVHPETGRIHADWHQIGADSGRMACTRPNLQNVPRSPAYRACFKAPQGRVLVKADYSQIELRIAAEIAGDTRMLDAYQRGEDLHALTARLVLGKQDVTKADRQAAKALNFGLVYGMGAETLRQHAATGYGVTLTPDEAARFRSAFFRAYPGLRAWHRRQSEGAITTTTLAGRKRFNVSRYTEKLNTPVQGTGADGLKAALALLWETRDRCPSAVPVLVVHDEIVIECDAADAETARAWLVECMRRGMSSFLRKVPIEVEVMITRDWSGQHA